MTITAQFTEDSDLVSEVLLPVWGSVSEDGMDPTGYEIPSCGVYVKLTKGSELIGLQLYHQMSSVTYEFHTVIMEEFRHTLAAFRGQKEGWRLMFTETDCEKINSSIPAYRTDVLRYASGLGMLCEGTDIKSWRKFGKVFDQIRFGITKDMFIRGLKR